MKTRDERIIEAVNYLDLKLNLCENAQSSGAYIQKHVLKELRELLGGEVEVGDSTVPEGGADAENIADIHSGDGAE